MFKNKKAELVKEMYIEEMKKATETFENRLNIGFDLMDKCRSLEKLVNVEKEKCIELLEENKSLKCTIELYETQNNKLYELLDKLHKIVKSENKGLEEEISELKSDRYRVVKIKPTKAIKQEIKAKSGARTSKIIKKVKES